MEFINALKQNHTLTNLDLANNGIEMDTLNAILSAIPIKPFSTCLNPSPPFLSRFEKEFHIHFKLFSHWSK